MGCSTSCNFGQVTLSTKVLECAIDYWCQNWRTLLLTDDNKVSPAAGKYVRKWRKVISQFYTGINFNFPVVSWLRFQFPHFTFYVYVETWILSYCSKNIHNKFHYGNAVLLLHAAAFWIFYLIKNTVLDISCRIQNRRRKKYNIKISRYVMRNLQFYLQYFLKTFLQIANSL